jgi:periplasmic copper chaperone A
MIINNKLIIASLMVLGMSGAFAQNAIIGKLAISDAYVKETVPGQTVASGFVKIKNTGPADKLVAVSSATGSELQLHTMKMEGNVMKMAQIPSIDIAANSSVELTPDGMHIMIMGLKTPAKAGDTIKIKLKFANSGEVEVNFPVLAMAPMSGHDHGKMKM